MESRRQALQVELAALDAQDAQAAGGTVPRTLQRSNAMTRTAADRAADVAAGLEPRQKATISQVSSHMGTFDELNYANDKARPNGIFGRTLQASARFDVRHITKKR